MFDPLVTERLLIRPFRAGDADALYERRNDPEVAELQSWETPYPRASAERVVAELEAMDSPPIDEWWMLTIERRSDGATLGDLALHLSNAGRTAEIGYTLARSEWGHGYATEAAHALVDHLFSRPEITRVCGMLHPDNHRSARVLEHLGMRYEGLTRLSFWVGDENSDDLLYGMTRDDYDDWRARPTDRPTVVELIEVTPDNQPDVYRLVTHKSQERFVSPNLASFAHAQVPEVVDGAAVVPWYRAVVADGELVGFVMMAEVTDAHPEPYLWRLMVDRRHQRRRIGDRVLDLVIDQARAWGASTLVVSWEEGVGGPRPFYERRGFVPTGQIVDGETEARLTFDHAEDS
ncbi:MAG: GNAT family N-acetyltransferase [Actinomycetota bacterium]